MQALVDHFWRRWLREYVPYLTERRKWLHRIPNLKIDDVVIVVDPNSPRGHWPLARVVAVYPDPSGTVRTALVKTKTGSYIRPVSKLCLLEAADSSDRAVVTSSHLDSTCGGIGGEDVRE